MNRSSPSWSARTGRSPERGRTGRRAADLPNSFASARRPRQWATMPRWTTRQLVTKYMANSGGDAGGGRSRPGKRAGLIMWVASATQPACDPDRKQLDDFRAWARPHAFSPWNHRESTSQTPRRSAKHCATRAGSYVKANGARNSTVPRANSGRKQSQGESPCLVQ
jgi:hypothetical protein